MDKQHNKETREELRKLLEKLYDQAAAKQAAEDIEAGEKLLRDNPVLEPAEVVKRRIKAAVGRKLAESKQKMFRTKVYKALATAAVIIITLTVSTKIIENGSTTMSAGPRLVVMDTGAGGVMDAKAAVLSDEVTQAENQLSAIRFGQTGNKELNGADELETEYITIASDFWKGE